MRQIGHLEKEAEARAFGDFLYVQGIASEIESEPGDGWAIWIHSESDLERASQLLTEFRADPQHPRYQSQAAAAQLRAQAEKEQRAYARKVKDQQEVHRSIHAGGFAPATWVLIGISAVVFFLSNLGSNLEPIAKLLYSEYTHGMPEIRHGELWRLFTPMFIHFGIMHIVFNMMWLFDLGGAIESRESSWRLLLLVGVIAAVSNTGQYVLDGEVVFGGMSGVVYGLLGYVWMKSKFDPFSGYIMHPTTMLMMIVWFFLCLVHFIPHVANAVHAFGLGVGLIWGYLSSLRRF